MGINSDWTPANSGAWLLSNVNLTGSDADWTTREAALGRSYAGKMKYKTVGTTTLSDMVGYPFASVAYPTSGGFARATNAIYAINAGTYDSQIIGFANAVKAISPVRVWIRLFWEANLHGSVYNPINYTDAGGAALPGAWSDFQTAWIRVWTIFFGNQAQYTALSITGTPVGCSSSQVKFAYAPNKKAGSGGTAPDDPTLGYPGTQYVDWIMIDTYPNRVTSGSSEAMDSFSILVTHPGTTGWVDWYNTFSSYGKPLGIGETCVHPVDDVNFQYTSGATSPLTRVQWWTDALAALKSTYPLIRMVTIFDANDAGYPAAGTRTYHTDATSATTNDSGAQAFAAYKTFATDPYMAPSTAAYTFDSTGNDGGGRGNACAIDQANSLNCALAGDVWGTRNSTNGGDKWIAKMQGQNGLVYGRAVAFSAKHAGRSYWGVGTLKNNLGGGRFCMQDPANVQLVDLSSVWGFGSNLTSSTNPAGIFPRACGNRIVVDYDAPSSTEYVYGQAGTGIFRAVDTTGSLANYTGFPGTAPIQGGGLSMVLAPDGSLYAIDWGARTSETVAPSQTLWHITNPRGTPTVNTLAAPGGGGPMNRLKVINGIVWLLCANGLFKLVGSSWVGVAAGFFGTSGHTFSDVCGAGQTMYVSTGTHPAGTAHAVAKSTDGGLNWAWVTSSANFDETVQGTNRRFWLTAFNISRGLTGDPYGTNSMECGPTANFVLLSGARGAFTTKDGGATWHPSANGLMGTEVSHIGLSSTNGEAWNDDTDWGTIHTLDHYQTVTEISASTTGHSYRAASLTSADGVVKLTFNGSFWDIQKNGVSVADTYSKGAIVNPTDVEHTTDDWIYISQFGGGVTAGNPSAVGPATAPTMGSPTLSTSSPVVGQAITAFPNPNTWDGTPPLGFTYQWQRQDAGSLLPSPILLPSPTLEPR